LNKMFQLGPTREIKRGGQKVESNFFCLTSHRQNSGRLGND
jgi:hypothetical protein